jgi:nucleoside-diphosphate-sugar epimerase
MLGRRLATQLAQTCEIFTAGRDGKADIFIDLNDPSQSIPENITCDALVHCAASFEGDTFDGALQNEKINALGSLLVAKVGRQFKCRHIVCISSIFAYSHTDNEYYTSYGMSKAHGEDNLRLTTQMLNISLTCLRVSQMYDEFGESRRHQPFFHNIIGRAACGQNIEFYGTKDRLRNFIHVEDVVSVIQKVLYSNAIGDFPVVFPKSYTLSEIATTAFQVYGTNGGISFRPDKPDIKSVFIPQLSDLYERIGFMPQIDLHSGISLIRRSTSGVRAAG